MWKVSPTQNNRHYVRRASWHRLRVGSILDLAPLALGQALGPIRSAGSPIANEHADLRIYMHQRNALYSADERGYGVIAARAARISAAVPVREHSPGWSRMARRCSAAGTGR